MKNFCKEHNVIIQKFVLSTCQKQQRTVFKTVKNQENHLSLKKFLQIELDFRDVLGKDVNDDRCLQNIQDKLNSYDFRN